MKKIIRKIWIITLILFITTVIVILTMKLNSSSNIQPISLTAFYKLITSKKIISTEISNCLAVSKLANGSKVSCLIPDDSGWITHMITNNINVTINSLGTTGGHGGYFGKLFSTLIENFVFIGLVIWLSTRNMSFKQSVVSEKSKIKFSDLAGLKKEKMELQEVVYAMNNIDQYSKYDCKPLRGVLLYGPPGNGKTMLGKAIAGETHGNFIYCAASEFADLYVGMGPRKVRGLFELAREAKSAVIFIDEADALGSREGANGMNSERVNIINQLLVEMDGLNPNENIIVIFATNLVDNIDSALLRKGRIDREIEIGLPDQEDRYELLKLCTKDISLANDVNLREFSKGIIGFSRAEIAALINETKIFAMRENSYYIHKIHLEKAKDRVILGLEKDIKKMQQKDLKLTAYHESGHAFLMYYNRAHVDPIYKATIVPHGHSLGVVISSPQEDKVSQSKIYMESRIQICFAGRLCEEIFFGLDNITSGCSSDIQQSRRIAEAYVRGGMSNKHGLRYYSDSRIASDEEKNQIYQEVSQLLYDMEIATRKIIMENKESIKKLAEALLVAETLSGEDIVRILSNAKSPIIPYKNKKIISIG